MRNPEFEPEVLETDVVEVKRRKVEEEKREERNESGYSEKQQALDIEMRTGDLSALKKSKIYQSLSSEQKKLVVYKTVSNRLGNLLEQYDKAVAIDLHRSQKLMTEIAQLKILQTIIFNSIIGKTEEELDTNLLPEELSEFI